MRGGGGGYWVSGWLIGGIIGLGTRLRAKGIENKTKGWQVATLFYIMGGPPCQADRRSNSSTALLFLPLTALVDSCFTKDRLMGVGPKPVP